MSLLWVSIGAFVQVLLGAFVGMASIFIGGALANSNALSSLDDKVLTSAIFVLPICFAVGAVCVWIGYFKGTSALTYLWYSLPWLVMVFYIIYGVLFLKTG